MINQSHDNFTKIKQNSIIIIGGGRSILNFKLGDFIDSFQTVGRINNFITNNYEEHIGSKTDIWFNGANQGLKKRQNIPPNVIVLIPPPILIAKGFKIHNRIKKRLNTNSYELVDLEKMQKFEHETKIKRITTGTNAILWALDNFNQVIIHGFDFFIDNKSHYHDGFIKKWFYEKGWLKTAKKHEILKEKTLIESLIYNKQVIKLTDLV